MKEIKEILKKYIIDEKLLNNATIEIDELIKKYIENTIEVYKNTTDVVKKILNNY